MVFTEFAARDHEAFSKRKGLSFSIASKVSRRLCRELALIVISLPRHEKADLGRAVQAGRGHGAVVMNLGHPDHA